MDEVLLNTAVTLPVMLKDVNRDPVTGVVFGDVTCTYSTNGAALGTLVVTTDNWTEIGQGLYTLDFTAGEIDTLGWFTYLVTGVGAKQYNNTVKVVKTGQVLVSAAYNASTTALVIRSWLHVDGLIITAPTSVALSVRDAAGVEQFTYASSSPSAQGVFTITDTGPALVDDHNYVIEATITYGANTYTSGECLLTIS
jgi:hypothetical protein